MKKIVSLLLSVVLCVFFLPSCEKSTERSPDDISRNLRVVCGTQSVLPVEVFITSTTYDNKGNMGIGCGGMLLKDMPEQDPILFSQIPTIKLTDRIKLEYSGDAELEEIIDVCDENFNYVELKNGLDSLYSLANGTWYVILSMNWQGYYNKKYDVQDVFKFDHIFKLVIEDIPEVAEFDVNSTFHNTIIYNKVQAVDPIMGLYSVSSYDEKTGSFLVGCGGGMTGVFDNTPIEEFPVLSNIGDIKVKCTGNGKITDYNIYTLDGKLYMRLDSLNGIDHLREAEWILSVDVTWRGDIIGEQQEYSSLCYAVRIKIE